MTNKRHTIAGGSNNNLTDQSADFLDMLTKRGIIEDPQISSEKLRQAEKVKKRNMYHNTQLLLKQYRDISWSLECFPADIAEDLNRPMHDLDALLNSVNAEIGMNNHRLENRLLSVQKSRMLLDRLHEALSILKQKPGGGSLMYDIIYQTYIIPEKLSHTDIIYRLNISTRHYYRLRQQAIHILSNRLWSVSSGELDSWLEVLTLLENV